MLRGEREGEGLEVRGGLRGGGRSAVQLCFPEPGISLCLTDMWTFRGEKVGEKKRREREKQNEGVSVMTAEVTKAQTDSKKKEKKG